jgi:hypothetical protein
MSTCKMIVASIFLAAEVSCAHTTTSEFVPTKAIVTGIVTSTSGASVSSLLVTATVVDSQCRGQLGPGSGTARTDATGHYRVEVSLIAAPSSWCVVAAARINETMVLGTSNGRDAEFRAQPPFDEQNINIVIP